MINFSEKQEKELIEILSNSFDNAQTFDEHKKQNKTNEHQDAEIVNVLARDFPHVFEQILEYLDNI
tara:strand:- start:41 stop:238 length:198 start_codon:yes stop_codon:yes gene_type:complete